MALTYLQLTNRVLKRIGESEISEVTTATGNALIITELINEAHMTIANETNWVSLYTTRTFATVDGTAEYALASDFHKGFDLIDTNADRALDENHLLVFDSVNADSTSTGTPTDYTVIGNNYYLFPIPNSAITIRDRYFKVPTTLTANANTSDLPVECENSIIYYALSKMKEVLSDHEAAKNYYVIYKSYLEKAMNVNDTKLNKLVCFKNQTRLPYLNQGRMPFGWARR